MSCYKANFGQFMTNEQIADSVATLVANDVGIAPVVLEPSYGAGQFISSIKKHISDASIVGYEIDKDVFKNISDVKCYNEDFLFSDRRDQYDLIIGNPPYIELAYSFYSDESRDEIKKAFGKRGRGRLNLVHAFMDRSFELLKEGGVIAFLLPSTILSSPWYNDIRKTIYQSYTIKNLILDIKFPGVAIQVCLLVIKKEKGNHNFIIKKGDVYQIGNISSHGKTIKELGFKVGIGKYCWSHYKPQLNKEGHGPRLLYSSYIKEQGMVVVDNKNEEKMPYLNVANPVIVKDAIVFPRTNGKKLKMHLIEDCKYAFENHIVYITGDKDKLKDLFTYLNENKDKLLALFNSALLTKTEVESISAEIE